ncbi:ADP-dependent glucokinase/phosphofructokinase [Cohnella sp.]|uniref:ADP-dependent glucokinase/phosphofructokinase n=1 Tax=Cohnella sp. TaxID=1883426 RepID=UPI0035613FD8
MSRIACGFTANLDGKAALDPSLYERLCKDRRAEGVVPRKQSAVLRSRRELAEAIAWNVAAGSGGEYIVADEELLRDLRGMADWEWAIGGTGLQAARAAAAAGHEALVNLPAWTERFDDLLDHDGLRAERNLEAAPPVHYILEFSCEGRANRLILRGTGEFSGRLVAAGFAYRLENEANAFRALLVSGYNAADNEDKAGILMQEQIDLIVALGAKAPPVHLELAAFFSREAQLRVIERFRPYIRSVGCNEDEIGELLGLDEPLLELPDDRLLVVLEEARSALGVSNLILHTREFAACLSGADADGWKEALRSGTRFAVARAVSGKFCSEAEIAGIVAGLPPNARGLALAELAAGKQGICVVPAFEARKLAGTVGLGDTFAGGLLVAAPPR